MDDYNELSWNELEDMKTIKKLLLVCKTPEEKKALMKICIRARATTPDQFTAALEKVRTP